MGIKKRVLAKLDDATYMRKFHGWFSIVWFVAAFPICIFLSDSIPFIVFVSVYAIVVSHWSSWQAARIEEKEDAREAAEASTTADSSTGAA